MTLADQPPSGASMLASRELTDKLNLQTKRTYRQNELTDKQIDRQIPGQTDTRKDRVNNYYIDNGMKYYSKFSVETTRVISFFFLL